MIKIALIEDNSHFQEQEVKWIQENWRKEEALQIRVFSTAEEFLVDKINEKYDILIVDIELPGISGIEMAKELKKREEQTHLVFLTSHGDYALESYEVKADQYVLKSQMETRLPGILAEIAGKIQEERSTRKVIIDGGRIHVVPLNHILYFCKDGKYVKFVTVEGVYRERTSLGNVEKEIGEFPFVKVERGFIVNARHIYSISSEYIELDNGESIPVSRRLLTEVKKQISDNRRSL